MKKKNVLAVLLLLAVFAVAAWAFWPAGPDPQLAKVAALQEQAFKPDSKATPEERRKTFEELRTEAEKLTPEQRGELMRTNPPPFMREMQKTISDFAELPENKRKEFLDKHIDRMESRRKEMQKRFADRGAAGPGGPPGGPGGGPPGGGRGGFGGNDPQRRQEMQKKMLDNTSPDDRAKFGLFFREMAQRRQERGMPPMRGPF